MNTLNERSVIESLRPIQDPDLHRSIVDLGFVKNLIIENGHVKFDLELTTPACPMKSHFKEVCVDAVSALDGVKSVEVNMTAQTRGSHTSERQVLNSVKNIIAIASGKGGVAKSTTAVNLAVALQQTGASVGILDADIYGPSIPTMIRIETPALPTPDKRLFPAEGAGLKLISMGLFVDANQAAVLRGPMVSQYVSQFLNAVEWGDLDYLIIDYPPGTGDIQLTLSQQAPITGALIVTTPQKIALADVKRAIAMFKTTKVPIIGVCETMSYFLTDDKKHYIFGQGGGHSIAAENDVPFHGEIPIDPLVTESGDSGIPILISHPESPVSKAYRSVAGSMAAQLSIINMQREEVQETFSLNWES